MKEKTTVVIKTPDGEIAGLSGETVIVFTINNAEEFADGTAEKVKSEIGYFGYDIPEVIFSETIASLVAGFIESRQKAHPVLASYNMHEVSNILEKESKKVLDDMTPEKMEKSIKDAVKGVMDAILG